MENTTSPAPQPTFFDRNRTVIKGFLIGILILIMLIPAAFTQELVRERQQRQQEVVSEVSSKWAGAQTIAGPLLVVPYKFYEKDKDGKVFEYRRNIYLLPEQLAIHGKIDPEVRHRSLYDVTLYRSTISLEGAFGSLPLEKLRIAPESTLWNEAHLLLGLNDARGLEEEVKLNLNDQPLTLEAGLPENTALQQGLSTPLSLDSTKPSHFNLTIKLKGSERLFFTPVGKTTEVTLSSSWKDPAFDGQYLPTNTADVSDSGFNAKWKILQVSRNYPQYWIDGNYDLEKSSFGVKLIQPADGYAKTERSVKYALLFIALTFTVFFFMEILQKRQIHPLQYLLVGFALCIFYTLLLSISEYTGFNPAYFIAASATVCLIGLYVWSIFRKGQIALGFALALGVLYSYIFILIQLQDYALLFGSIGLFVILAILMFCSRKIDWYNAGKQVQLTK
jgi:inner membrane protein